MPRKKGSYPKRSYRPKLVEYPEPQSLTTIHHPDRPEQVFYVTDTVAEQAKELGFTAVLGSTKDSIKEIQRKLALFYGPQRRPTTFDQLLAETRRGDAK